MKNTKFVWKNSPLNVLFYNIVKEATQEFEKKDEENRNKLHFRNWILNKFIKHNEYINSTDSKRPTSKQIHSKLSVICRQKNVKELFKKSEQLEYEKKIKELPPLESEEELIYETESEKENESEIDEKKKQTNISSKSEDLFLFQKKRKVEQTFIEVCGGKIYFVFQTENYQNEIEVEDFISLSICYLIDKKDYEGLNDIEKENLKVFLLFPLDKNRLTWKISKGIWKYKKHKVPDQKMDFLIQKFFEIRKSLLDMNTKVL